MRGAIITAIACMLLLTSCPQPLHWPIPQLTVPTGAVPSGIPREMLDPETQKHMSADGSQIVEGPNVYTWGRGFTYALGWDSLVKHVEGEILPLGYTPYSGGFMKRVPSIPGVPDGTLARSWISPDGKYMVGLINLAFIRDRNPGALDNGQFTGAKANYLLGIDQLKDLPPQLQSKVQAVDGP